MSTSHIFAPCIFHRLSLSLPLTFDAIASKSLSGHHEFCSNRLRVGRLTAAIEEKLCVSMSLTDVLVMIKSYHFGELKRTIPFYATRGSW